MEQFDRSKIIVMRDVRGNKMCSNGAREFCKLHNIDWDKFLKEGITCGEIIDTGDSMGLSLVRYVHGR